ncbi:MAG TPA: hypothetical protein VGO52_15385 [Hyphomonadaceae bacterium]|nr:hypothetical protein [Hyphomonadaceae bacterium]
MKILGFGFLFVLAAALVLAMLLGVAIQIIGYGFLALLVVGGVSFVMNKVRGPKVVDRIDHVDPEQLPR